MLLAVWVLGISCSMKVFKCSLCVPREMLECLPRCWPKWSLGCPCMLVPHAAGCKGSLQWAAFGAGNHPATWTCGHAHSVLNHLELGCPNPECPWILFKWKGTSMLACCIKRKRELSERNHTVIATSPIFSILKQLAWSQKGGKC